MLLGFRYLFYFLFLLCHLFVKKQKIIDLKKNTRLKFSLGPVNQQINLVSPQPATLLKKRLWHRRFPVNFAKLLKTPF